MPIAFQEREQAGRLPLSAPGACSGAALSQGSNDVALPTALGERLDALAGFARTIRDGAAELEELALRLLPYPCSVIREDVALAAHRLERLYALAPLLAGRAPVGVVALCLPDSALLSDPIAAVGASYLAGNVTRIRVPRKRSDWSAAVAALAGRVLGAAVVADRQPGPAFIEQALADPAVGAVMVAGDDRWCGGYEAAVRESRARLVFEGSGKDPFLVLDGADAARAAQAAANSGLYNAGQARTAVERIYVVDEVYADFVDALVAAVEAVPCGPHSDARTRIGSLDRAAAGRVLRQLADARSAGARILTGGDASPAEAGGGGRVLITPAVVTGVDHGMALMTEETRGPVLPVMRVGSAEEAVRLAQDSPYGLTATVYGGPDRVRPRLLRSHGEVFAGRTWLDRREHDPSAPSGGRRRSGWVWEWRGDQFVRRDGPLQAVYEFSRPARPENTQPPPRRQPQFQE